MRWILPLVIFFAPPASSLAAQSSAILITIDSLRADHLEPYGYEKIKTPAISALAREGVTFEKAVVQTPLTAPSHASILTGTYPQFHGLQNTVGNLKSDVSTLAEWFREQDYETGAFVGSAILLSQWGLNRGFQTYDDHFSMSTTRPTDFDQVQRPGELVIDGALNWIGKRTDKKFFLWLHLSDAHEPHNPPEPFSEDYASAPYDGEIAYVDSVLSHFFGTLKEMGLYEKSLIVLTAPHGTSLGEHGEESHGFFLYQSSLHVPLILKLPDGRIPISGAATSSSVQITNLKIPSQVRSVDLAPTMIELLGGEVGESMQGRSLIDFMTAGEALQDLPAYSETHYPRLHFGWSSLYSYSSGRYKFILSPDPELYDLASDPAELNNIYEQSSTEAERLREELEKCRAQFRSERNLMEPDLDAADPKSRMEVYWQINDSIAASRAGQYQKALNTIRDVLQKDPQNPAAHFALGSLYLDQRQYLLAVQEFRSSFEQSPLSYENRINLSLAYLQAGLNGRAQELLKGILDENPADSVACQFLAISYAKQGKLEEAITLGRKAVELRPLSASAHYNLGSYYLRSGKMSEAEHTFEKVIELAPNHVEARANLSHVLLSQGLKEQALQKALELVKLAPDYALGHFYLGQAYEANGLTAKAEAAFRKAKELDPRLTVPVADL